MNQNKVLFKRFSIRRINAVLNEAINDHLQKYSNADTEESVSSTRFTDFLMSKLKSKPQKINRIPQLFVKERVYFKYIWILLIICLIPCAVWFFIQNMNTYLMYSYIKTQAILRQDPDLIIFPSVTICGGISPNNLLKCSFNNLECKNKSLTEIIQFSIWNTSCFTLSRTKSKIPIEYRKMQIIAGYKSGLELEFFSNDSVDNVEESLLVIHDRSLKPRIFTLNVEEKYKLKWELVNAFTLEFKSKKLLGEPFNHCVHDLNSANPAGSKLFNEAVLKYGEYNQQNCFSLCYEKHLSKECNCSNIISCPQKKCILEEASKYFGHKHACRSQCPLECSKRYFTASAEEIVYQPNKINNISRLILKMYYNELNYSESTEVAFMTLKYLIISTLSIFTGSSILIGTGFSLISFLEILEMLLELTSILILKQPVRCETFEPDFE